MVASDMMNALMALCEEKHIDQGELIRNLEQSLAHWPLRPSPGCSWRLCARAA